MTFSIVAIDPETREIGSAVASRSTAVGGTVCYSRIGVGVVNTQHYAHLRLGARVLDAMEQGREPPRGALPAVNLDLRVDDHSDPLRELRRLHRVFSEEFGEALR